MTKYIIMAVFVLAVLHLFTPQLFAEQFTDYAEPVMIQGDEGEQPFDEWYGPDETLNPENTDTTDSNDQEPLPVEKDNKRGDPNADEFEDTRPNSG